LVQLPGIKDASSAKDLINRTARLDFMMVDTEFAEDKLVSLIADAEKVNNLKFGEMKYSQYVDKLNEALKGKIPADTYVYFEKAENATNMDVGRRPYLVKTNEAVAGDKLTNATVGFDNSQMGGGAPIVSFSFDAVGARLFGELTQRNIHKPMAIVLDKVVKSAPTIQSAITGGHGQITLGRGRNQNDIIKEAKVIATALRAGALPAALEQVEERTVGPSLGADAIKQGQIGTLIAALAVFIFMFFYYKSFGLIADLSLAFNLLITVAILSALGATLTLPGVAGLALTLGIAVDASVIIFERVKEEMGKGAALPMAIREGYERAFSSIFDANVTSIAVCVVLMYYGTGPVRGFAVTLLTGLVITTFTAVFFTRAVMDLLVGRMRMNLSVK
jgi:preprotein translocase subunit SecD